MIHFGCLHEGANFILRAGSRCAATNHTACGTVCLNIAKLKSYKISFGDNTLCLPQPVSKHTPFVFVNSGSKRQKDVLESNSPLGAHGFDCRGWGPNELNAREGTLAGKLCILGQKTIPRMNRLEKPQLKLSMFEGSIRFAKYKCKIRSNGGLSWTYGRIERQAIHQAALKADIRVSKLAQSYDCVYYNAMHQMETHLRSQEHTVMAVLRRTLITIKSLQKRCTTS
jgi:hypothetical protein